MLFVSYVNAIHKWESELVFQFRHIMVQIYFQFLVSVGSVNNSQMTQKAFQSLGTGRSRYTAATKLDQRISFVLSQCSAIII